MSSELSPFPGRALSQLERHGHAGFGCAVALCPAVSRADGGERAFDRVDRADVAPVLGREVTERQQSVPILPEASHGRFVSGVEGLLE